MDDEQDDGKPSGVNMRLADSFVAATAANQPAFTLLVNEFTNLLVSPMGEVRLDFQGAKMGPLEVLVRLEMAAPAAQALKAWLLTIESIPGTPPAPRDPRSTN